jgi:hypothetical protein
MRDEMAAGIAMLGVVAWDEPGVATNGDDLW